MKYIYLLLFLFGSLCSNAQGNRITTPTRNNPNYTPAPYYQAGQLLNIANAYSGNLKDTPATGTTTIYLQPAINGSIASPVVTPVSAADTFVPIAVTGDGTLEIIINGLKISGAPAGAITLETSVDGSTWGPSKYDIVVDEVDTVKNVSTLQTFSKIRTTYVGPFFRLKLALTGTEQSSWTAWYCLKPKSIK